MNQRTASRSKHQSKGFAGILVASIIGAALILISNQGTIRANMDAYHAPNKANIEISNQLTQAGLRYVNNVISTPSTVQQYIDQHRNNPNVVLACSATTPLPGILSPVQTIHNLPAPTNGHEVLVKGIFAPYDCNLPISSTNYRATFETTGSVGCNTGNIELADNCVTRSVVQSAYDGQVYRPQIEVVQVTYTCPTGPHYSPVPGSAEELGIIAACAAVGVDYKAVFFIATEVVQGPIQALTDLTQSTSTTGNGSSGAKDKKQNVGN